MSVAMVRRLKLGLLIYTNICIDLVFHQILFLLSSQVGVAVERFSRS